MKADAAESYKLKDWRGKVVIFNQFEGPVSVRAFPYGSITLQDDFAMDTPKDVTDKKT